MLTGVELIKNFIMGLAARKLFPEQHLCMPAANSEL